MRKRIAKKVWAGSVGVLLGLPLVPGLALADTVTTAVSGRVVDVNGNPIPNAQVVLRDTSLSNVESQQPVITSVTTDASGRFTLQVPVTEPNSLDPTTGGPSPEPVQVYVHAGGRSYTWEQWDRGITPNPGYLLIYPSACDNPDSTSALPGRCGQLVSTASECALPSGGPLPDLCNPSWSPAPPSPSFPSLPGNWFHLGVDPFPQGGSVVARDAVTTASGPFGSTPQSSGGQTR